MTRYLRIREPGKHIVLNPTTGVHDVPDPSIPYASDHPLVQEYPWMFVSDDELMADREAPVEQVTARPGEYRTIRRRHRGGAH